MDGLTSSTIMYHYLHEIDPNVDITCWHHSHKEHGLNDLMTRFDDIECDVVLEPDAGGLIHA